MRLTHLLAAGDDRRPPDALATGDGGARFFVPGWLTCGECGPCRRGWLAACPRGRALDPATPELDAEERFLTPVDDPPGALRLEDDVAACGGVVAEVQELAAKAGLGSGDPAVWIGDDARMVLGARLSAARGCPTFHLRTGDDPRASQDALAAAAASAPGGFLERRIFIARADPRLVEAALALVTPGTSLAFFEGGSAALPLTALASCRVIVGAGFGYHPDLVPEALAALRRDPKLTDGLLTEGPRHETRLALVRV